LRKAVPIVSLILVVLGGLYGGFLNPTEAGAAGAAGALVIALLRRSLDGSEDLLESAGGDRPDHGVGAVPDPGGDLLQPHAGALGRSAGNWPSSS
jgi:hypothetical protein